MNAHFKKFLRSKTSSNIAIVLILSSIVFFGAMLWTKRMTFLEVERLSPIISPFIVPLLFKQRNNEKNT